MKTANIIFPHQLFKNSPLIENGHPAWIIEEYLFFKQYNFHKQKIAFHRSTMKSYTSFLQTKGIEIHYVNSFEKAADIRLLIKELAENNYTTIHYIDPADNWLERRINKSAGENNISLKKYYSPSFLNTGEELKGFFKESKKKFFQTEFYKSERIKKNILIVNDKEPVGGKWSFDADNRQKYPAKKTPPLIHYPEKNAYFNEARQYVSKYFNKNQGELTDGFIYPIDFLTSEQWLQQFLEERFKEFGPYEDAIVKNESILHHSVLSPLLNTGLITPQQVIEKVISYYKKEKIPLNSAEGFIRQIIGWREFIRGMYECKGTQQRKKNYWGFTRKIPSSFYDGTTGFEPLDITIKKILKTSYCHHIERLMVLGNFMLLCEFDPDEVYRWFMELFIDAYDWVMVPNVYGMSQFADGGLMSTKPYISGSNYLMKMSDYSKGPWQKIWDALFWRFMHVHRNLFESNPRLGMLVKTFDKMPAEKQTILLDIANNYLNKLDKQIV